MSPRTENAAIAEQLGALRENMERGREDRSDLKNQLTELRQAINGLQQSSTTANGILADLAKQNLGERVAQLENHYDNLVKSTLTPDQFDFIMARVKRWDAWIGGGRTFVFKVLASLLGSATVAALIVAAVLKLTGAH